MSPRGRGRDSESFCSPSDHVEFVSVVSEQAVPEGRQIASPSSSHGGFRCGAGSPALMWAGRHPLWTLRLPGTPVVALPGHLTFPLLILLVGS